MEFLVNQRGEIMILTTWILSTIIFFKNSQHARTQIKFSVLQCWILKFYCKLQTTFQLLYNCNIATSNSSGVKLICRQFVDLKRSKKDNTTSFDEKGLPASIESKFRFLQVNHWGYQLAIFNMRTYINKPELPTSRVNPDR